MFKILETWESNMGAEFHKLQGNWYKAVIEGFHLIFEMCIFHYPYFRNKWQQISLSLMRLLKIL